MKSHQEQERILLKEDSIHCIGRMDIVQNIAWRRETTKQIGRNLRCHCIVKISFQLIKMTRAPYRLSNGESVLAYKHLQEPITSTFRQEIRDSHKDEIVC